MFGKVKGQEESRRYEEFSDQHGRLYGANVEISTGDPCEVLRPLGWTAPMGLDWAKGFLIPPEDPEIRTMVPRAQRARRGYQIFIDYAKWLEKWDARMVDYQRKMQDYALGMSKSDTIRAIELMRNPTPELLKEVGGGPKPPREFIEAAAAGNRWALGLTDEVPRLAKPILDAFMPVFAKSTGHRPLGEDPFADDGEEYVDDLDDEAIESSRPDPFADVEKSADLEEQFDPDAKGGRRIAVGRAKSKGATQGRPSKAKAVLDSH